MERHTYQRPLLSLLLRVLTPWLNLVPPQGKRAIAPPQACIHPARIAEPRASLAPSPHARLPRMAVRALRPFCVRERVCLALLLLVRGNEGEGPQLVALLEV